MNSEKEMDRLLEVMREISYKCPCGKTVMISKQDRALCPDCGHWVYKTRELEFRYKMKERLFREKRKENGRKKEKL